MQGVRCIAAGLSLSLSNAIWHGIIELLTCLLDKPIWHAVGKLLWQMQLWISSFAAVVC